jgi:hypothetical protein
MYKHKSGAAKRKKKPELDANNAKNPKITNFFNSPNDDVSENSFLFTDLCTETSFSSCYSQLPTVSEPNADTDIVVVHIISEDKEIEKMQVLEEDHLN